LEKSGTFGKERCTIGKRSGTFGKMRHINLKRKCGTVGKMLAFEKRMVHLESEAYLEKSGTFAKVRHLWKKAAHLEKSGTFEKARHI